MAENVQALLEQADQYMRDLQWDAALECCQKVLTQEPQSEDACYKAARIYAVRGLIPDVVEQYFKLMEILELAGDLDQSLEVAKWIQMIQPENDKARLRTIEIYKKKNDPAEVVRQSVLLARLYIELGKGDESIALLREAQNIDPDNLDIGLELADVYISHGHINDAVVHYRKVANAYLERGDLERALDAFRRIKVIISDDPQLLLTLGNIYLNLNRFNEAEIEYRAVLRLDLGNVEALMALGNVCQLKGQFRDAILAFNKILSIDNQEVRALEKLGELYQAQGNHIESIKNYLSAANIYQSIEETDKAVRLYQRVLSLDPTNPTACRELTNLGAPLMGEEDGEIISPYQPSIAGLGELSPQPDVMAPDAVSASQEMGNAPYGEPAQQAPAMFDSPYGQSEYQADAAYSDPPLFAEQPLFQENEMGGMGEFPMMDSPADNNMMPPIPENMLFDAGVAADMPQFGGDFSGEFSYPQEAAMDSSLPSMELPSFDASQQPSGMPDFSMPASITVESEVMQPFDSPAVLEVDAESPVGAELPDGEKKSSSKLLPKSGRGGSKGLVPKTSGKKSKGASKPLMASSDTEEDEDEPSTPLLRSKKGGGKAAKPTLSRTTKKSSKKKTEKTVETAAPVTAAAGMESMAELSPSFTGDSGFSAQSDNLFFPGFSESMPGMDETSEFMAMPPVMEGGYEGDFSSYGNQFSSGENGQPLFGSELPDFGGELPSFDGAPAAQMPQQHLPGYDSFPSFEEAAPVPDAGFPGYSDELPLFDAGSPVQENQHSGFTGALPAFDGDGGLAEPSFGGFGTDLPSFDGGAPSEPAMPGFESPLFGGGAPTVQEDQFGGFGTDLPSFDGGAPPEPVTPGFESPLFGGGAPAVQEEQFGGFGTDLPAFDGGAPPEPAMPGFESPLFGGGASAVQQEDQFGGFGTDLPSFDGGAPSEPEASGFESPLFGSGASAVQEDRFGGFGTDLPSFDGGAPSEPAAPGFENSLFAGGAPADPENEPAVFGGDVPSFGEAGAVQNMELPSFDMDIPAAANELPGFDLELPSFGEALPASPVSGAVSEDPFSSLNTGSSLFGDGPSDVFAPAAEESPKPAKSPASETRIFTADELAALVAQASKQEELLEVSSAGAADGFFGDAPAEDSPFVFSSEPEPFASLESESAAAAESPSIFGDLAFGGTDFGSADDSDPFVFSGETEVGSLFDEEPAKPVEDPFSFSVGTADEPFPVKDETPDDVFATAADVFPSDKPEDFFSAEPETLSPDPFASADDGAALFGAGKEEPASDPFAFAAEDPFADIDKTVADDPFDFSASASSDPFGFSPPAESEGAAVFGETPPADLFDIPAEPIDLFGGEAPAAGDSLFASDEPVQPAESGEPAEEVETGAGISSEPAAEEIPAEVPAEPDPEVAAAEKLKSDVEELTGQLREKLEQNELTSAIELYDKILELQPMNSELRQELADLYYNCGLASEASRQYELLLEREPSRIDYLQKLSILGLWERDTAEAEHVMLRIARAYRENSEAGLAMEYYQSVLAVNGNNLEAREELIDMYLDHNTDNAAQYHLKILGQIVMNIDSSERAVELLKKIYDLTKSEDVFVKLAGAYESAGMDEDALAAYREILYDFRKRQDIRQIAWSLEKIKKFVPRELEVYDELSAIYQQLGDEEKFVANKYDLANHFLTEGKTGEAQPILEEIIGMRPDFYEARYKVVEIYFEKDAFDKVFTEIQILSSHLQQQENYEEAAALYERLLASDEENIAARQQLAEIYVLLGRNETALLQLLLVAEKQVSQEEWESAVGTYGRVLEIDPSDSKARYALAVILSERMADDARAMEELGRVFQSEPVFDESTRKYVELLLKHDRPQDVMEVFDRLVSIDESYVAMRDEMVENYRREVEESPDNPYSRFNLGIIYKGLSRIDDAIEQFQKTKRELALLLPSSLELALCFSKKPGMNPIAVRTLIKALEDNRYEESDKIELRYTLGNLYQATGKNQEALEAFGRVFQSDENYKDVAEKIAALKE